VFLRGGPDLYGCQLISDQAPGLDQRKGLPDLVSTSPNSILPCFTELAH